MVMVFDFIQTACVIIVLSNILSRRGFFSQLGNADKPSPLKTMVCVLLFVFLSLYGILIRSRIVSGVYVDTRIVGLVLSGMLFGSPISYFVFVPTFVISIILGEPTLWADLIAMLIACIISAICHKKFPNTDAALTGIITGLLEIVHILLIPVFVRPIEAAKGIMYTISFPMIVVNGCAAILFVLVISDNNDRRRLLEKESAAKSEYNIAREIQSSLINKKFDIDERLDLSAYLKPAYEVGGDLYSYVIEDGRYFKFIMGDVSGKGISAAITMSRCEALFEEIVSTKQDPAEVLSILNRRLSANNQAQMFVTAMVGILDLSNGELVYSNAGHVPPYLIENGKDAIELERPSGKPLGIIYGAKYENRKIKLKCGQYVISYTDGVTDALNIRQESFGKTGLMDCISNRHFAAAGDIKKQLIGSLDEYSRGAKQADDIAVICFGLTTDTLEYSFGSSIEEYLKAAALIDEELTSKNISKKTASDIKLVLEEVISNIINYAYDDGQNGTIKLSVTCSEPAVIQIEDDSKAFDLFGAESGVMQISPKDRLPGGLGIMLTKNRVRKHTYISQDNKNILTMILRKDEG